MGPRLGVGCAAMGTLTKVLLDELLSVGCACGGARLNFSTYVDGRFTLLAGEQFGDVAWAYKGETFIDGVFEIACASCQKILFSSDVCPRCNAPHALAAVLESPNRLAILRTCPKCNGEMLTYTAMLPARVVYERKQAQKARPRIDMVDDGFHGFRIDCKACGVVAKVVDGCPLCAAPGPLRAQPH